MYGPHYFHGTISVTFHRQVSADNVAMPSTGCTIVGRQAVNIGTKVSLLARHHRLEVMRQQRVESDVSCIQQHIQVHIVVREVRVANSKP